MPVTAEHSGGFLVPVLIRVLLTIVVVWAMSVYLGGYFVLTGGIPAVICVGLLIAGMNIIIRPILNILTYPLKLFATLVAIIIVNGAIVYLSHMVVARMDPSLVTLQIAGGVIGWAVVAAVLGTSHWVMKIMLK